MRLLIAALNARFVHASLAIRLLRNAIDEVAPGRDEIVLRDYVCNQGRLAILRDMVLVEPDALLLSVSIWSASLAASLLPDVRALLPGCLVVLGGPEVSYDAPAWLSRFPFVDLIVSGAGEGPARLLARARFDRKEIAQRAPGKVLSMPEDGFPESGQPYREADFAELAGRFVYYESSRGCPFACSYCLSSRDDQETRAKPASIVVAELGTILAHRPGLVKFLDRTYNADPPRAREIWRFLVEDRRAAGGTRFHFEIHPSLLGEGDFSLLSRMPRGLFQFEIGVQTVVPRSLAAIGRPMDWESARDAIRRLAAMRNIHIHLDMIVGLPGEGVPEVAATFDELLSLGADHVQMGFLKGLKGTALRERAGDHGLVFQADPPYEILKSDRLSPADLAFLSRVEELLEGVWNGHRFDALMARAAERRGGWFKAFESLSAFCAARAYEVGTRQEAKLRAILEEWEGA